MRVRDRISYLRGEHAKLLQHADSLTRSLELASSPEFPEQQQGLARLRRCCRFFDGIAEHCHAEHRVVESVYQLYLNKTECARVAAEHRRLLRLLADFREELLFATADRTASLVDPGTQLANSLRTHIAHEQGLLRQIAETKGAAKRRAQRRKRKAPTEGKNLCERSITPYTMEVHPEL